MELEHGTVKSIPHDWSGVDINQRTLSVEHKQVTVITAHCIYTSNVLNMLVAREEVSL